MEAQTSPAPGPRGLFAASTALATGLRRGLLSVAAGRPPERGVRVLAYHLLPVDGLAAHVSAIRQVAEIVDEDVVVDELSGPSAEADRPRVMLTFDDGYLENVSDEALRMTERLGVRPTIFVVAAAVEPHAGVPEHLVPDDRGAPYPLASSAQLRRAVDAGWHIGSHTTSHWDCSRGDSDVLSREIGGSKLLLEQQVGVSVKTFAYPWGKPENFTSEAIEEVRKAGYAAAFTTRRGTIRTRIRDKHLLPRDVVEAKWQARHVRGCLTGVLNRLSR